MSVRKTAARPARPRKSPAAGSESAKKAAIQTPKRTLAGDSARKSPRTGNPKRPGGGAPDETYIAAQPAEKRALLEPLRAIVLKVLPEAEVSIKWGVPFYAKDGRNVCALATFKEHVGINFFAAPEALTDPGHKLEGAGKGNRMLKVRTAADIDRRSIERWLKAALETGARARR